MRPHGVAEHVVNSSDNITSKELTISQKDLKHLMGVLTRLYSDIFEAVLREYSTNGWDSHVEAGKTDTPIEVMLPNELSPFLIIQDRGVGLSKLELEDIYSSYGASTKRDTDTQTGTFGLGCKSALAYVPQFNITAVKDGIKNLASISSTKSGGKINFFGDPVETDEPNGVRVEIPIAKNEDISTFQSKAKKFFQYWKPGMVLVDGEDGTSLVEREYIHINDTFRLVKAESRSYTPNGLAATIVQGNVAYPVKEKYFNVPELLTGSYTVIIDVPIGTVGITPPREELEYTQQTVQSLKELHGLFKKDLAAHVTAEVAAAPNHYEALKAVQHWRGIARSAASVEYRGEVIPLSIPMKSTSGTPAICYNPYSGNKHVSNYFNSISISEFLSIGLVITGYDKWHFNSAHSRQKVKDYVEENELKWPVLLIDSLQGAPWTDHIEQVPWETISKRRVSKKVVASRGFEKHRVAWYSKDHQTPRQSTPIEDMPKDRTLVIVGPKMRASPLVFVKLGGEKYAFIEIDKKEWKKFQKAYPGTLIFDEWVEQAAKEIDKSRTDAEYIHAHAKRNIRYLFRGVDVKKIDDPELVRYLKLLNPSKKHRELDQWNQLQRYYRDWTRAYSPAGSTRQITTSRPKIDKLVASVEEKYPFLFNNSSPWNDHAYVYVNSLYKTEYREKQ